MNRRSSSMDPLFDEQDPKPWGRYVIGAAIAGIIGFILYAAFAGGNAPQGPVPVMRADQTPWTRAPSESGGMEIPNQDSMVYDLMEENGDAEAVEELAATPPEAELKTEAPKTMDDVMSEAIGTPEKLSTDAVDKAEDKPVEEAVTKTEDKPVEKPVEKTGEKVERTPDMDAPYNPNKPVTENTPSPPPAGGGKMVTVRLGSMPGSDTSKASTEFARLKGLSSGKLTGSPNYEPVTLDKGSFVRINTMMSESDARSLCDTLSSKGAPCLILDR